MDLSSPLRSLAAKFSNFAIGVLATILSWLILARNTLHRYFIIAKMKIANFIMAETKTEITISEGGLKIVSSSPEFFRPRVFFLR